MPSIIPGYEYDIFISYRQNDNRSGWVTEFVKNLQEELAATIKEPVSVYFDSNPHDGLLETHNVDKSLEGKLKCLIFIPILSQTYCDPKSFAWQHEFVAFNKMAKEDQFGRDVKLSNGNVASRLLPVQIHDLDPDDKAILETEIGGVLRPVEFIFGSSGVNRPLTVSDNPDKNFNKTFYRDQVNKVANAIKQILQSVKSKTAVKGQSPQTSNASALPSSKIIFTRRRRMIAYVVLALLIISVSVFLILNTFRENLFSASADRSIAVLPFVNISNDPEQEYFSDGLTEEIILQLSGIADLFVTSRSSAMTFKGTQKKLGEIASDLKVKYILEGTVRKSNSGLVITARLIDAKKDVPLWGEKFSGNLDDIFDIQEKVSRTIVEKLKINLTSGEEKLISRRTVVNVQAYELLMRAKQEMLKFDEGASERAKAYLQRAIDIEGPNSALYAVMGYAYFTLGNLGVDGEANFRIAKEFVQKALKIDPQVPEIQLVQGLLLMAAGDQKKAVKHLRMLLKYRPNDYDVLVWSGAICAILGQHSLSQPFVERLLQVDPLNATGQTARGFLRFYNGQFKEALPYFEKASDMDPVNVMNNIFFLSALVFDNQKERAQLLYNNSFPDKKHLFSRLMDGLMKGIKKDTAGVRSILTDSTFTEAASKDFSYAQIVSSICGQAGMDNESMRWLKIAVGRGFVNYPFLVRHDPSYRTLRGRKDFQELMEHVKKEWENFEKDTRPADSPL